MRYYFAPMEGLTDQVFRQLHHQYFPGVDAYFTPFFSPTSHRALTPKERRELPEADSIDARVVPQILTKVAEDFVWMSRQCLDLGYDEINLNLGCPSGTVTAKGKGSGMLREPEVLDAFLEEIFAHSALPVSIKTRVGFSDPEELPRLMEIFNQYPIRELTVHPRLRSEFYKGPVHRELFEYCLQNSKNPLCYNGDITSAVQAEGISREYPGVEAVMVGRGLISDPGMFTPGGTDPDTLERFMNALMDAYVAAFGSVRNTMFRMKEHWGMLLPRFPNCEKLGKRLRKTTDISEFKAITAQLIDSLRKA
ncbi:MAG: tRNA-dihydrouridine synthase family protein [Ruminococcaceae bacterium]|nr:tRNA-dihydrouridine synthase family protein [Oscillospiraceae bacterium]